MKKKSPQNIFYAWKICFCIPIYVCNNLLKQGILRNIGKMDRIQFFEILTLIMAFVDKMFNIKVVKNDDQNILRKTNYPTFHKFWYKTSFWHKNSNFDDFLKVWTKIAIIDSFNGFFVQNVYRKSCSTWFLEYFEIYMFPLFTLILTYDVIMMSKMAYLDIF